MGVIETLALGMGGAWASGVNLYGTVIVLGLMNNFGLLDLPSELQIMGSWWVLALAIFLYLIEFVADKIPIVDSIWDAIHTFIRIPAGALLAAGAMSGLAVGSDAVAERFGGRVDRGPTSGFGKVTARRDCPADQ